MNIQLLTPAPLSFNNGNKITAVRWVHILEELGHKVTLGQKYNGHPCDILIALHARRSYQSIRRFHDIHPTLPLIVVMTGTDLYRDIRKNRNAQRSLDFATRIVALQRMALSELPKRLHEKTRVIYQSAEAIRATTPSWESREFNVCVIGHLRAEKDPLRAAMAIRNLPSSSKIRVLHVGRALDESLERRTLAESQRNPRYRWIGEISHHRARKILAKSHLAVITSRMEGSSNVLSEALASSVPVLASKISGLIGTLGEDYPGYFPVGNTGKLRELMLKAESDPGFYRSLKQACARVAPIVSPAKELRAWKMLLRELEPVASKEQREVAAG